MACEASVLHDGVEDEEETNKDVTSATPPVENQGEIMKA